MRDAETCSCGGMDCGNSASGCGSAGTEPGMGDVTGAAGTDSGMKDVSNDALVEPGKSDVAYDAGGV